MSSKQTLKKVWRVPKHRGPAEAFAGLLVKMLRKHHWPAVFEMDKDDPQGFFVLHYLTGDNVASDFRQALGIAVRVTASTYRVEAETFGVAVRLCRPYRVTPQGQFKEIPQ